MSRPSTSSAAQARCESSSGEGPFIGERIGILGGTFDPVHYGHLFAAQEVADVFGLDRVLLVPCGDAPHKAAGEISAAVHRVALCEIASANNDRLAVSRVEVGRPGPSYAYDTVSYFLETTPREELHFILGTDAFALIHTWYRYPELLDLCRYVVVRRPGYPEPAELPGVHHSGVAQLTVRGIEMSSTEIRERVAEGRSIRYLVPPRVEAYVREHRLYRR